MLVVSAGTGSHSEPQFTMLHRYLMSKHEDTYIIITSEYHETTKKQHTNTGILQPANAELLWGCHRFILPRIAWLVWSGILSREPWWVDHLRPYFVSMFFSVVGLTDLTCVRYFRFSNLCILEDLNIEMCLPGPCIDSGRTNAYVWISCAYLQT